MYILCKPDREQETPSELNETTYVRNGYGFLPPLHSRGQDIGQEMRQHPCVK